jgi:UDP-N-acetylmuramoyl-tripeptide--D-alanyl-D-alanine ligase
VLNADDPSTLALAACWRGATLNFGLAPGAQVRAEEVRTAGNGTATAFTLTLPNGARTGVEIPWLGEHNVRNALAAAAAAFALGADAAQIRAGLAAARPAPMRFEVSVFAPGVEIVNDAYNANPASMRAALAALARMPRAARTALVLGDMLELGDAAPREHRALGAAAAAARPDLLVAVGALAGETAARGRRVRPPAPSRPPRHGRRGRPAGRLAAAGDRAAQGSRAGALEGAIGRLLTTGAIREQAAPPAAGGRG